MNLLDIYYRVKPIVPRRLQIALRRALANKKRGATAAFWPIDERAAKPPVGWQGWPEGKKFAVVLLHDVDTAGGVRRTLSLMQEEIRLGFRSSFNFVPERYRLPDEIRLELVARGFEIGVHGLKHDGKLFRTRKAFDERMPRINAYLEKWRAVGFSSPSMLRNLNWVAELNIEYSCSSYDTDPYEPQNDPTLTIFPFAVHNTDGTRRYIELPYTLPQDHCLFIILRQPGIEIWKRKLDWIAEKGGMALLISHPDYMDFSGEDRSPEHYPSAYFFGLLEYIKQKYENRYWQPLPREIADFWTRTGLSRGTCCRLPRSMAVERIPPP